MLQFSLELVGWSKIRTATSSGINWIGVVAGGGVMCKDYFPSLPFAEQEVVGSNPETVKSFPAQNFSSKGGPGLS